MKTNFYLLAIVIIIFLLRELRQSISCYYGTIQGPVQVVLNQLFIYYLIHLQNIQTYKSLKNHKK